jgi:hypothetical protein
MKVLQEIPDARECFFENGEICVFQAQEGGCQRHNMAECKSGLENRQGERYPSYHVYKCPPCLAETKAAGPKPADFKPEPGRDVIIGDPPRMAISPLEIFYTDGDKWYPFNPLGGACEGKP